jgi:hypothetical protein
VRLTLGLRSPLAFRVPDGTGNWLEAPAEAVAIEFEARTFVWHPPFEREDELARSEYGPMVAVVVADDEDGRRAAPVVQRFLSAIAYYFDQPVDDGGGGFGGDGGSDPFNPFGSRQQRAYPYVYRADAPTGIAAVQEKDAEVAFAYYREGLNASSPFYRCVAFRNVLDVVFSVVNDTVSGTPTEEARARDAFIESNATRISGWFSRVAPPRGWPQYLREEVRNALAHVNRSGRREINPDDPTERVRINDDSTVMRHLARAAIEDRWTHAVTLTTVDGQTRY